MKLIKLLAALFFALALIGTSPGWIQAATITKEKTATFTDTKKAPEAMTKLKVVYAGVAGSYTPVWIAKEERLFEKYGLDVDFVYIPSALTAVQTLLSGAVPVVTGVNGAQVISANLAGSDVTIIGVLFNTVIFYLMVAPNIQSPADLKGKALGVTRIGSLTDFALRFALRKLGLDPEKDVTIVQMPGVPAILTGMENRAVAGGALSSPTDLKARKAGFKEMMDIGAAGLQYPGTAIASTRSYIHNNGATLQNVMRAIVEGTYLFKTNKPLSMAVIGKYTKTEDKEMLEATYDAYVGKVEKIPYPSKKAMLVGIEEVARTNPRAKGANPDSFVDIQFVKQLEDSGFIKQLYKE